MEIIWNPCILMKMVLLESHLLEDSNFVLVEKEIINLDKLM